MRNLMVIKTNIIVNNIKEIKQTTNKLVMAVLKSNAYNLGASPIIKGIYNDVDFFVFNHFKEYLEYQDLLADKQTLILESINKSYYSLLSKNIRVTVNSVKDAENVINSKLSNKVHIQVDTGMNRDGIKDIQEYQEVVDLLKNNDICIEGLYSHFVDGFSDESTNKQLERFNQFLQIYKPPLIHFSATSATHRNIIGTHVRVGMALYGYHSKLSLKGAFKLYTPIYKVNKLFPGESVGYNSLYTTTTKTKIGVIPIGYYEGFRNRFIYKGNKKLTIVGKICMNHSFVLLPKTIKNSSWLNILPLNDKIDKEEINYYEELTKYRNFSRIYIMEYYNDLRTIFKKTIKISRKFK